MLPELQLKLPLVEVDSTPSLTPWKAPWSLWLPKSWRLPEDSKPSSGTIETRTSLSKAAAEPNLVDINVRNHIGHQ